MNELDVLKQLELKTERARLRLLDVIYNSKTGHTGGDLSSLNILATLYFNILNINPKNKEKKDRDRFILSKGHSIEALYSILEACGFISSEQLNTYGSFNTLLTGHPSYKVPGIEISGGSLGHGLSIGVGMAIGGKLNKLKFRTFVLMGDGELGEGSIYEAAMAASHYKLDHLVAIVDRNGLQISNSTEKVMGLEPLKDRWVSLGWDVKEANGDNTSELLKTLKSIDYENHKPTLIIAKTTKGYGVSFMENQLSWHHGVPTEAQYIQAKKEISEKIQKLENTITQ